MSAHLAAQKAYSTTSNPLATPRGTEYEALGRVTVNINKYMKNISLDFPHLVEALHENRKLWTLLATSVAEMDNRLPQELRAKIFYLAEFTHHQTEKILIGECQPDILIEVNSAVMKGLRSNGSRL